MRKYTRTALVALSVLSLALASCYWRPDSNSGGLRVDVSGVAARLGSPGDVIRVYIFADGLLFSAGGGSPFVAEVPASGGSQEQKVQISGLPLGPRYRTMIGVGPLAQGVFAPYLYGDSGEFQLNPNADTSVTVSLDFISYPFSEPSFSPDLLGKNLKDVVDDSISVFAAEESKIYYTSYDLASSWSLQDSFDLATDPSLSGFLIRGLSRSSLYANHALDTNNGLVPFSRGTGWAFYPDFSQARGGSRETAQSGSFPVPATRTDYAVFFRRQNSIGGAYVPNKNYSLPSAWNWVSVEVSGATDLVLSPRNAYYAADGDAFALPPAFLIDGNLAAHRINLPSPAPVLSLGFRPDPQGLPVGTLTLGTSNGVYQIAVDETWVAPPEAPAPVPGTAGQRIERIAIPRSSSNAGEAYLSRQYLYIRYNGSLYTIPFFAAFPGRATGLAWDNNSTLYISGTEGLAAIDVE